MIIISDTLTQNNFVYGITVYLWLKRRVNWFHLHFFSAAARFGGWGPCPVCLMWCCPQPPHPKRWELPVIWDAMTLMWHDINVTTLSYFHPRISFTMDLTLALPDGRKLPQFGLGTWQVRTLQIHGSRHHFVHALSQWETALQCNIVAHWLGACTKWSPRKVPQIGTSEMTEFQVHALKYFQDYFACFTDSS